MEGVERVWCGLKGWGRGLVCVGGGASVVGFEGGGGWCV